MHVGDPRNVHITASRQQRTVNRAAWELTRRRSPPARRRSPRWLAGRAASPPRWVRSRRSTTPMPCPASSPTAAVPWPSCVGCLACSARRSRSQPGRRGAGGRRARPRGHPGDRRRPVWQLDALVAVGTGAIIRPSGSPRACRCRAGAGPLGRAARLHPRLGRSSSSAKCRCLGHQRLQMAASRRGPTSALGLSWPACRRTPARPGRTWRPGSARRTRTHRRGNRPSDPLAGTGATGSARTR